MERRNFIRTSALIAGLLPMSSKDLLASFYTDPWKISMLRNNIGIFTEKGGTIAFMLSKKGIVVIDSQFPEQSQNLINELKKEVKSRFVY